jgi:hypothetical protein
VVQNEMDWWTHNDITAPCEIDRILVTIDETTWANRDEIANVCPIDESALAPGSDREPPVDATLGNPDGFVIAEAGPGRARR